MKPMLGSSGLGLVSSPLTPHMMVVLPSDTRALPCAFLITPWISYTLDKYMVVNFYRLRILSYLKTIIT